MTRHRMWTNRPASRIPRGASMLLAALVCAPFAPAEAQVMEARTVPLASEALVLPLGTRVRVAQTDASVPRLIGNVARMTSDSLAVATAGGAVLIGLPLARVRAIESSTGRPRGLWALRGAGIGALAGAVGGAALAGSTASSSSGGFEGLIGLIMGGVLGIGTGAVTGAIIAPEGWQRRWP